jgi:hypothetical protein
VALLQEAHGDTLSEPAAAEQDLVCQRERSAKDTCGPATRDGSDRPPTRSGKVARMSTKQRYRLRNPATGRELLVEAEAGRIYRDRETDEPLEVIGKVLPLAPSQSRLPWAVENLRFCPWCEQHSQKDLNDCPTCGRRMGPL